MSVRKLTVTSCEVKYDPPEKDWTLYEVAVVDEAGEPIREEFKSFDMLPIGELVEYQVERQDHPTYGTSFMLKLPKGMRAAAKPNVQAQILELQQRVARLESQAQALTGTSGAGITTAPAMASMPNDDSIPFLWKEVDYGDRYHSNR